MGTKAEEYYLPEKRVRIQGKVGDTNAYHVQLTDMDTGEPINNIYSATIVLDIETGNHATLMGYKPFNHAIHGSLPTEQIDTKDPVVDVTVCANIVQPDEPDHVFKIFRTLRDKPLIQFLTWWITLIAEWKFEDLADFHIMPEKQHRRSAPASPLRTYIPCRFVFRDGRVETLRVEEKAKGEFAAWLE